MGGFFGAACKGDAIEDVFFGTDYHSHLGTRRGGMAAFDPKRGLQREIHNIENSPFRTKFEHIFDEMTDFAKYAFNKAHAACYAVVSYRTAWLKYYYPVEFMAALMTSVIDNSGKVAEYIMICRSMGIDVLPPDINQGESFFTVKGDSKVFALNALKSVCSTVIENIVR